MAAVTVHLRSGDFSLCPNHQITWALSGGLAISLNEGVSEGKPCVLCGSPSCATLHDFKFDKKHTDIDWPVCRKHLDSWIKRHLLPEEVLKIRKLAGCDTFDTHDDFYDQEGNSIQPV